jgi:uncharacterized protein with gpF-like domain
MPPYEFQELVADLLRAMGYHVAWIADAGKDGGIDIVAYNDPLGTRLPRIKVQVKRHNAQKIDVAEYWRTRERQRAAWEQTCAKRLEDHFEDELADIKRLAKDASDANELFARIELESATNWKRQWATVIGKNLTDVAAAFGKTVQEAVAKSGRGPTAFKWSVFDGPIRKWIENHIAQEVVLVSQTTIDRIQAVVVAGFEAGSGLEYIVSRIEEMYLDQIIPNRSKVIARTEVHSASMAGTYYAAKDTGVPMTRQWVSSQDSYVRDSHEDMHGRVADIDEPWSVNGSMMMFPGDASMGAAASEIIHCRCDEVYRIKED